MRTELYRSDRWRITPSGPYHVWIDLSNPEMLTGISLRITRAEFVDALHEVFAHLTDAEKIVVVGLNPDGSVPGEASGETALRPFKGVDYSDVLTEPPGTPAPPPTFVRPGLPTGTKVVTTEEGTPPTPWPLDYPGHVVEKSEEGDTEGDDVYLIGWEAQYGSNYVKRRQFAVRIEEGG